MPNFIERIKLYTDGGCRGNPGPGAIAFRILDTTGTELECSADIIGETTNNRAEYYALIWGLECAAKYTRRRVDCFLDSELVVKQVTGSYRLKNKELRSLFYELKKKETAFEQVTYQRLPRENPLIKKVDALISKAYEGR
jgi:ribonuclease HI